METSLWTRAKQTKQPATVKAKTHRGYVNHLAFAPVFHALGDKVLQIEKAWHETFQDLPEASSNLESQPFVLLMKPLDRTMARRV
jgi:hypothetical protein